jgi:hypothetical protein
MGHRDLREVLLPMRKTKHILDTGTWFTFPICFESWPAAISCLVHVNTRTVVEVMHHASVYLAPCPITWCLLLTAFQDVTTSIIAMEDVDQSHLGENQRRLSVVHAASHVSVPNNQDVSQLPGYPNAYHIAYHSTFYRKCRYAGQIKLLHIYIHLPYTAACARPFKSSSDSKCNCNTNQRVRRKIVWDCTGLKQMEPTCHLPMSTHITHQ